ncbi:MAG: type VI secretion system membrane subunit TssM, partial [Burkholderiales bacterium]
SVAGWYPFEPVWVRVALIVLVLLLWLGGRAVRALRAKLANRNLFEALGKRAEGEAEKADKPRESADSAAVRSRFDQAQTVLRDARFGGKPSLLQRVSGAAGRRYVYELPWYMFLGAPGSGKTTALLNAGLEFPLASRLGKDPLQGVAGTRNCEWWFTDAAVLIDTAGRYATQDSDHQADAREWGDFLGLLRKFRPRLPINGALLTVSVDDLTRLDARARQVQASAIRDRLRELRERLGSAFPVYVIVTKADLLAGFMESFDGLDRERREQVFGRTFEWQADGANAFDAGRFSAEFDALVGHVAAQALDRMQTERDPARRALIFGFPQQLAALKPALSAYLETALGETRLAVSPIVRGFYLASGTQEGNPIDRVLGALGRSFGFQSRLLPALRPSGKAFFLHRLLAGVVFPEANLAGTNRAWERRRAGLKWALTGSVSLLALIAIVGWTVSYFNNSHYVDTVAANADQLRIALDARQTAPRDVTELLPVYAAVRSLPRTEAVDPADPELLYRLGLFQGRKLDGASNQAYQRLLRNTLAPALAARIASVLQRGTIEPEFLYETLKVYLMLGLPERLDREAVKAWVALDLELGREQALAPEQRQALLGHVDALLARGALQASVEFDDRLIADVRNTLARTPFPQRVYNRLRQLGVGSDFQEFRISDAGGPSAAIVFTRKSGAPLTSGVPGLYTYDGYHKGFSKVVTGAIAQLAEEETWVLGIRDSENARRAADPIGRNDLATEVKRLYLQDYAEIWERLVNDVAIIRGNSLAQNIEMARLLSGPESPIVRLTRAIGREVSLTLAPDAVAAAAGKAAELAQGARQNLQRLLSPDRVQRSGPPELRQLESIVDDRFDALRALVRSPGQGQPAPIEQTRAMFGELYKVLVATDAALQRGAPAPQSDLSARLQAEAGSLPEPIRGALTTLAEAGAAQTFSAIRQSTSQNLEASVGNFCKQAIGG